MFSICLLLFTEPDSGLVYWVQLPKKNNNQEAEKKINGKQPSLTFYNKVYAK